MKKFIIAAAAGVMGLAAVAQNQVQQPEAMDYQRCNVTVIAVGNNSYSSTVKAWADSVNYDGKFDKNIINATAQGADKADMEQSLRDGRIGKKVVDYWLDFDGKQFGTGILETRSRYNATDADVLRDRASKVSTLMTSGRPLMKNSYVIVVNPVSVVEKTDKKGKVSYDATVDTYVYRVALNDTILDIVWGGWLDDEATAEAVAAYNAMDFDIEEVASVQQKANSKNPVEAVITACNSALEPLEKKIDKWQVVTSIYEVHPIRAKIGTKEGVHNSDRFACYKTIEDEQGNLNYKRIGYVRATDVVNNSFIAEGETGTTKFYQLSGRGMQQGMFLKQKKDARSSISFMGAVNSYQLGAIQYDYLMHTTQTMGIMQYIGIQVGADYCKDYFEENALYANASLNYSIGIHPVRILEVTPNIGVGVDYYGTSDAIDTDSDDSKVSKRLAYFARGGVKVGVQVWYPVQVFVSADYAYSFSEGEQYVPSLDKRFKKLGFGAGIKINF